MKPATGVTDKFHAKSSAKASKIPAPGYSLKFKNNN